jgi:imidazoleglycerol phosphate synthase glutamine amidotransferase subunit HisH
MYFVHSYVAAPTDPGDPSVVLENEHGERFPSAVATATVVAVQFHPEKSSSAGLKLLGRFLEFSP